MLYFSWDQILDFAKIYIFSQMISDLHVEIWNPIWDLSSKDFRF